MTKKWKTVICGALIWSVAFAVFVDITSLLFLTIAAVAFVCWQWICWEKYGAQVTLLSCGIVIVTCIGVYFAPCKALDRVIVTVPKRNICLRELVNYTKPIQGYPMEMGIHRISLPHSQLSMRQLMALIEEQTDIKCKPYYCFFGANLLFGPSLRNIYLQRNEPNKEYWATTMPKLTSALKSEDRYTKIAVLETFYAMHGNLQDLFLETDSPLPFDLGAQKAIKAQSAEIIHLKNLYRSQIQEARLLIAEAVKDDDVAIRWLANQVLAAF